MKKNFNSLRLVPYVLLSMFFVSTGFSQLMWERNYGGAGYEVGQSVDQTTDEGYIVVGYTNSFGNSLQVYLVKTDSLGDTLWTRIYGGTGDDRGFSVQQTQDRGYIIAGFSTSFGNGSQIYLIKTDSLGDTLWTRTYGGTATEPWCLCVQQTTDGGYILAGGAYYFGDYDPVYLIKTDEDGNTGIEDNSHTGHLPYTPHPLVFPNPFSSFTTVIGYEKERFILYDISGRRIGSYFGDRIGFGLPAGVYFIMPIGQHLQPIRVVKVK